MTMVVHHNPIQYKVVVKTRGGAETVRRANNTHSEVAAKDLAVELSAGDNVASVTVQAYGIVYTITK